MKTKNIESKLLHRTEMHKHKLGENRDEKEHSPYTPTFFGVGLVTVVCFMLLFVGIGVASATDYYVATGGDDNNPGTLNEPWQHPSYAAQRAVAGDTIYLMDGTWYKERVKFANSGTASKPIAIKAYSGTPTLDGVDKTITGGVHTGGHSYINIYGLRIKNYKQYTILVDDGSSYIHISDCHLSDTKTGLVRPCGPGSHHNTIENCEIHSGGWNLIQVVGHIGDDPEETHHIRIINNHIYDAPRHGPLDLMHAMHDIEIRGNHIHNEMQGSSQSAIFFHCWPEDGEVRDVTIEDNHIHHVWRGISLSGHSRDTVISNNNFHDKGSGHFIYGANGCRRISGCGNIFDEPGDVAVWDREWGELGQGDFTDPCDEDVGTISGTVGDVLPPTIIAYLPTGTEIPVETTITVTFSEAMHQSSAESAFSISPHVSGSFSWNGNKMIFTPSSDLDYITTCTVTISTVAEDLTGSNLESPFSWSFTTIEEDTTPPVMSDVNVMSATSSNATITWTTDESADSLVKYGISSGSYTESESDSSYVTSHSIALTGLTANTIYYYVVNSTDQAGNSNQSNVEYNFKTSANEYIWLEAEDADTITPDFEIASDNSASNGEYIRIPEGVGYHARDGEATYSISIDSSDNYVIWGRKIAATDGDNSFFVQIDDGTEYLWTTALSDNWQWNAANHWGSGEEFNPEIDPVVFNLSTGNRILKIKQREDGTKLDKLLITNNMSYVPIDDIEDATSPTTTYVITPTPNEAGWNTVIQVVVTFFRSDTGGAGVSYTNYSETSETGPWTTVNINAAMGPDAENVTDIGEDKFNVTVSDEGVTTIWYYTVNNNATSEPIKNVTVKIDTTPPASISDLQNITGTTWIYWTWTNPTDADFSHTMVYLSGIFKTNTSNSYYNATGLNPDMSYEIGTHRVDTNGNVNSTWVNQTTKTVNNLILRYDVNEDGTVDILDTTIVGQHFGETTSPPYPRYDVNEDGTVDILDTTIVGQHFGEIMR